MTVPLQRRVGSSECLLLGCDDHNAFCLGTVCTCPEEYATDPRDLSCSEYWAIQRSWFARVNALCNLSRKKSPREVAAQLPGRFLSRRCFTLCITVEVEPRIAKQYKWQYCCSCTNYRGKGLEGGGKMSLRRFLADQKIANSYLKNAFWGIL